MIRIFLNYDIAFFTCFLCGLVYSYERKECLPPSPPVGGYGGTIIFAITHLRKFVSKNVAR